MPENAKGRVIHILSLLGTVGRMLASTSVSNMCMKAELKEVANARRVCWGN